MTSHFQSIADAIKAKDAATPQLSVTASLEHALKSVKEFVMKWHTYQIPVKEGQSAPSQLAFFAEFLDKDKQVRDILEIGFNAGFSAGTFLACRGNITVKSIDIGTHDYILLAQKCLENQYPGRLQLVVGDSADVLPQLVRKNEKYDMIYVDGGHEKNTPYSDINFSLQLVKPGGYILVDDYHINMKGVQPDVFAAVQSFLKAGRLVQIGHFAQDQRETGIFKVLWSLGNA